MADATTIFESSSLPVLSKKRVSNVSTKVCPQLFDLSAWFYAVLASVRHLSKAGNVISTKKDGVRVNHAR